MKKIMLVLLSASFLMGCNLPNWAKNPEFVATQLGVAKEVEGIGKEKSRRAVLTNLGWEIK